LCFTVAGFAVLNQLPVYVVNLLIQASGPVFFVIMTVFFLNGCKNVIKSRKDTSKICAKQNGQGYDIGF